MTLAEYGQGLLASYVCSNTEALRSQLEKMKETYTVIYIPGQVAVLVGGQETD